MKLLWGASLLVLVILTIISPAETLDAKLYYNQMDVWSFFQTLSMGNANRYFVTELLDLVFIFLYSSLLYLSIKKLRNWKKPLLGFAFIPGVFDFMETTWILATLKTGQVTEPVLWMGMITFLKWLTGFLVICTLAFTKAPQSSNLTRK